MRGAIRLAESLKNNGIETPIGFVCLNEGVYVLTNGLETNACKVGDFATVPGFAIRLNGEIIFTGPAAIVPKDPMVIDMPCYAWDLLPFDNKPLGPYR